MRVLIANTRHYRHGGDSSYSFALADALRGAGNDVAFFAMAGERNVPDPNADLFVSYIDFREMNRQKSLRTGLRVLARSIYSTEASEKFTRLVDRFQPDIVHLQNIHAHLTPSIIVAAKKLGVPVVWTMHDYKLMCPNSHFRIDATGGLCEACRPGRYHWAIAKRCKKGSVLASTMAAVEAYAHWIGGVRDSVRYYLSPSRFLASKLIEHGWQPDRVQHVPNFIDAGPDVKRETDGEYVLFVGRLEPLKGVGTLLDAAALVPGVKVVLAGGCDDEGLKMRLASLPPNVTWVGDQPKEQVSHLMAGARAVVVPSVCYDNQPTVALEAFAAAVPVIGSRIGGIPELVADAVRGLLIEAGDTVGLAAAMRALQADPARARAMGRAGREYVTEEHSLKGHLDAIGGIYRKALSGVETVPALA